MALHVQPFFLTSTAPGGREKLLDLGVWWHLPHFGPLAQTCRTDDPCRASPTTGPTPYPEICEVAARSPFYEASPAICERRRMDLLVCVIRLCHSHR